MARLQGMSAPPQRPRRAPGFRPRFTIGFASLAIFTLLFSFLMILPDMLDVMRMGGDEEAQYQRAMEVARAQSRPYWAVMLSLVATGLGAWFEVLPGLREG